MNESLVKSEKIRGTFTEAFLQNGFSMIPARSYLEQGLFSSLAIDRITSGCLGVAKLPQ